MAKQNYAIDIPVLIIFFNRPGCFSKVFEQVKKARPSKLLLYQDGAREGNENDAIGVQKCREIASDIDWDCEVYTLYQEKNYGCDPSGYLARVWAFQHVDKCIILEDDCVPSQSLFPFCKELLEKYKDDERINMICGMNNLETWETPYSYLFTETGSIWGVATWKRVIDEWDEKYSIIKDSYSRNKLNKVMSSGHTKYSPRWANWDADNIPDVAYHEVLGGICQFANNRLNIVPAQNMIINCGNTVEGGTHSTNSNNTIPRGLRKIYTMNTYEIGFPLKHPKYVINDVEYQKALFRVMGIGYPIICKWRRIEKAFLLLRYEGFDSLIKTLKKKMGK